MERYANEILTDNTKIERCNQCKDCAFWGNSDAFSNAHDKTCCDMYPYPDIKPMSVINNTGTCKYHVARKNR